RDEFTPSPCSVPLPNRKSGVHFSWKRSRGYAPHPSPSPKSLSCAGGVVGETGGDAEELPMTSLAQWLETQTDDRELASVLVSMAQSGAEIADVLRAAPIEGQTGLAGATNVQGEAQKALDIISNDIVLKHIEQNAAVSILISEELDEAVQMENQGR